MQKEKILSELYHGNINPVEKSVVQGSAYQKAMRRLSDLEEELAVQLGEEQKKLLQAFITSQGELNYTRMRALASHALFRRSKMDNGDLARFEAINEYVLPEEHEKAKLCSYEFDMLPAIDFGGSEGIYIDCSLQGKFDESGRKSLHIGMIKTLDTELDACKAMGELCGALLYHESRFVNENLYLFDSAESIERMLTKALTLEQTPSDAPEMTCQQM